MFGATAVRDQLVAWVDKAIDVQDGALRGYLAQFDGPDPVATLETQYLTAVSGSGAAVGGAASVPGIGTGLAVGLSVAETVGFLDATALFVLGAAQLRGHPVEDLPRRRALFLVALLGDDAVRLVPGDAAVPWGQRLVACATGEVEEISHRCERWLVTRFGPRQGMAVVGRLAPFGIGAAVGAAGNALTAKGVTARVRGAFVARPALAVAKPARAAGPAPADPGSSNGSPVASSGGSAAGSPAPAAVDASPAAEPPSGKYAALHAYLGTLTGDDVVLPIDTIGSVVPGGLPASARTSPAWWGNDASAARAPQNRAWLAVGLQVAKADLRRGRVRFVRSSAG